MEHEELLVEEPESGENSRRVAPNAGSAARAPEVRSVVAQDPTQRRAGFSRDEMNLAEFPLAVLSTRVNSDVKTLEFADTLRGKNGELVNRRWTITGADKFGLPTASDDEVLLGLMKLTSEQQFQDRKVFFTRYELLRILRWTTEGRSYSRLQKALDRLSGVRIKTTNGFYDNEARAHSTRNFGIIDAYEINDGRTPGTEQRPSFFIWSETIFKSFSAGFIKKLDLDFLLDLKSAVSKRLYRYLDKHFWYKARYDVGLFTLSHEKLGISRNYAYASQLRQQLDPAIEELIERGFLSGAEYLGKGSDTRVVFISAKAARKQLTGSEAHNGAGGSDEDHSVRALSERQAAASDTNAADSAIGDSLAEQLGSALVERGIKPNQLGKLIGTRSETELIRIRQIIQYFDSLVAEGSPKVSRSPIGFLYRAVEDCEHFILPKEGPDRVRGGSSVRTPGVIRSSAADSVSTPRRINTSLASAAKSTAPDLEALYLTERHHDLERLKGELDPEMMVRMQEQVSAGLAKLRQHLSPEGFASAVVHGVEEKLASLLGLPSFEEWKRERSKRAANR